MANVTLTYGPYNSKSDSKREYTALDIGRMFDGVITDGVFPWIGEHFNITKVTGLKIKVGSGRAWLNHTWNYLESPMLFQLENGDGFNPRYDAVILQVGCSELIRENKILIKKGEPSINPSPPKIENYEDSQYEYVIGYIYVPTNANELPEENYIKTTDLEVVEGKVYYIKDNNDYIRVLNPITADICNYYEKTPDIITNLVGEGSDPHGFYKPEEFLNYAYAIGDNHIGVKRITVPYDATTVEQDWEERTGSDEAHTKYYYREISITGIINNAILNADVWTEGDNITEIQKQENAFSYLFRHEIRDNKLKLWSYYRPDCQYTIRFTGKGVNNI